MKKKYLIICPVFLNRSETFIYTMLNKLNRPEVQAVCYDNKNRDLFPFDPNNIVALREMPFWKNMWAETNTPLNPLFKHIEEPELIHAHFLPSVKIAAAVKKHYPKHPPIVLHVHGQDFFNPRNAGKTAYLKKHLALADLILTPSEYVRSEIIKTCPEIKNIHCFYAPLDEAKFEYHNPEKPEKIVKLLSIGRLVEKKGFDTALKALQILNSKYPDLKFQLTIIGDGPLKETLQEQAKQLKTANISFIPFAEQTEIIKQFKRHNIFLAPSKTAQNGDQEGLPTTVIEALALGTPVIATRHSGIPEAVIDNQTGILFNENDAKTCAEKIYWAAQNWDKMVALSKQGRKLFEDQFSEKRNKLIKYSGNNQVVITFLKELQQ